MPAVLLHTLFVFLFCASSFFAAPTPGNAQTENPAPANASRAKKNHRDTGAALSNIISQINSTSRELAAKEKELQQAVGEERKRSLELEIAQLVERLDELSAGFMRIAAGIDKDVLENEKQQPFDVAREMEELLAPLILELKGLTERPREIERLRTKIQVAKVKIERIEQAEQRLKDLLAEVEEKDVVKRLSGVAESLQRQREQLENDKDFTEFQLEEYLQEEPSIIDSVGRIVKNFFETRGKNLLMALGAFIGVILFMRTLGSLLQGPVDKRFFKKYGFTVRLMGVAFIVLEYLGAFVAALVVFYVVGDWVLLGISIILIMGLVWSAKQGFARYWEQAKVLLNLGPVRKGERVVYNGLPWKVATLNYYSHLANPALAGGRIRVPLDTMMGLVSRPFVKDEPWFPTKRGDWVILSDETIGKVIMQTPEIVQLLTWGESRKTYSTSDFLELNPKNISTGWNVYMIFGVDYEHQEIVTADIPTILGDAVQKALEDGGYGPHRKSFTCEFASAGASSLDIAIIASFSGDIPEKYYAVQRTINRACVDACNANGWVIPFMQVTVHQAEAAENTQKQKALADAAAEALGPFDDGASDDADEG